MIGLFSWLTVGLLVGLAAHFLLPGPKPGWTSSLGTALAASLLGGILATLMNMGGIAELDNRALLLAFLVAALAVILQQLVRVARMGRRQ